MRTALFDYDLPPERIAQHPLEPRDAARLLVADPVSGSVEHLTMGEFPGLLEAGDLLVLNDTRVLPARLRGRKESGGEVELLLLRRLEPGCWEALVRPGRRVPTGTLLTIGDESLVARVEARGEDGTRRLRFIAPASAEGADRLLESRGQVPLPPYITAALDDPERYQTVYSRVSGSAAAPTAGLHFTPGLLDRVRARSVELATVTLHVGIATFRPIRTAAIEDHVMHREHFEVPAATAAAVEKCRGRVVAAGTTTARCLEAAATGRRRLRCGPASTDLYITPGYRFQIVDALLTNFHMPRSSLLVLVSAFAGCRPVRDAYQAALAGSYRFLSFGDAMFLPRRAPG